MAAADPILIHVGLHVKESEWEWQKRVRQADRQRQTETVTSSYGEAILSSSATYTACDRPKRPKTMSTDRLMFKKGLGIRGQCGPRSDLSRHYAAGNRFCRRLRQSFDPKRKRRHFWHLRSSSGCSAEDSKGCLRSNWSLKQLLSLQPLQLLFLWADRLQANVGPRLYMYLIGRGCLPSDVVQHCYDMV